jgi:tetratricopeptide (TPR) repeat protein
MARAAVKAKQAARAKAQQPTKAQRGRRGHAGGGNPNQNLFFMRLRRRQKWVFLALALVFAATFVGVGVGSGNGGLSQLYSGIFGGNSNSVQKAEAELKTNQLKGTRDLANAYIAKNDIASAVIALQTYLNVHKSNAGLWSELGGLQKQQGDTYAQQWQAAQQAAQAADPAAAFTPSGPLGTQLGTNPIDQYYAQQSSAQVSQLYQNALGAYSGALTAYQTVAKLKPHNAEAQYLIYTVARSVGQTKVALKALQRFVEIAPKSPQVPAAEQACQQLGGICTPAYVKTLQHAKK